MRTESKNWKLVKDKELLKFSSQEIQCGDCNVLVEPNEKWEAFLKKTEVKKGIGNDKYYVFRSFIEIYCQNCASN